MEGTATASTPSGAATTGPTSFSDPGLTWSDAPSASTPTAESTPAASASADATVPPAAEATVDGQPQQAGIPPENRWPSILENQRKEAAEKAITDWRAKHGWAEQVNPQEFQQIQQIARHFANGDKLAGIQSLLEEARRDPAVDAQLRSLHARALAQGRQPQQAQPDLNPIQVQLENGQTVGLYSADQIAALKSQWLGEVEQKFQPVTKTIETLQAREAAAVKQQEITHFVTSTYNDVQSWPGMDSEPNRVAVANELAKAQVNSDDPREVSLALERAWRKVVVPTLSQKAESQLLDSLKTKAAASASVNPGSAAPSAPRTVTRFDQLPPDAWR